MIGYLDTAAFVPLLIEESSSAACRRFWDDADVVVSSRLLYVETAAALARACQIGRMTQDQQWRSRRRLDEMWLEMDIVEVDDEIVTHAADLAHRLSLRGYDAVHCASAAQLSDDTVVAATGDQGLLTAWLQLGLATYDTGLA